mgnify:CR=1 FL=1
MSALNKTERYLNKAKNIISEKLLQDGLVVLKNLVSKSECDILINDLKSFSREDRRKTAYRYVSMYSEKEELDEKYFPTLKIKKIKSGKKVFDWKVPEEWNVKDAYVLDKYGKKIVDFKKNNLHLVGYSIPIEKYINRDLSLIHI